MFYTFCSKNGQKWVPRWSQDGPKMDSGTDFVSETLFGPILVPFWLQLGAILGAKLGPCWPKNWFLEVPEGMQKRQWFPTPFGTLLGPILERFGGPKSNQNRSKIGLKSDHEANAKILKIIGRGGVFEDAENRKAIKNQQKIVLKAILSWDAKRTPKNVPKSGQHSSNMGSSWGHVGLQDRLGPAQERRENDTENGTEKQPEKQPKKNLWMHGTGSALAL